MKAPFVLLFMSVIGIAVSQSRAEAADLLLLAGPCALASLILLVVAIVRRTAHRCGRARALIIDGSNVMYWRDGVPKIETVTEVLQHLIALGFKPGVIFDANAGYLFADGYRGDRAIAKILGLPVDRVMVVPKGTPADPYILQAARDMKARIISNDRFRDWQGDFPEIARPGHLIKGDFRQGHLKLDLPEKPAARKAA